MGSENWKVVIARRPQADVAISSIEIATVAALLRNDLIYSVRA
jgi:hypothetical protein